MTRKHKDKFIRYYADEEYISVEVLNSAGVREYMATAAYKDDGWGLAISSASCRADAARIEAGFAEGGRLAPQDIPPLYLIQELFRVMQGEWHGRTMEAYPSDARRMRCYARACKRAGLEIKTYEEGGLRIDITF